MTAKPPTTPTVGLISLGCPKNTVDSERMLAEIALSGLLINSDPSQAQIVIINTCGFIAPARAEAIDVIREVVQWKTSGPVKRVIVAGCLAQKLAADLFDEVDGIDAIVGLGQRDQIGKIAIETLSADQQRTYLEDCSHCSSSDSGRILTTSGHWTYLRISEGCNHKCSYCTIPAIRGPFRSKDMGQIRLEANELASAGIVELNLIAQDITQYGRDIGIKNGLSSIVNALDEIDTLAWLRLMYLWPVGITDHLIQTIAQSRTALRYLDIPIQHADDQILHAMKRPDTQDRLRTMIENLRTAMPDIVLRTTLIVGFPGETDRQFQNMLDFVKWAKFDALGCFAFCPEQGTEAAEMPHHVPDDVADDRIEQIMLAQQDIAFAANNARIGTELTVLVDNIDENGLAAGRFYGQAPEIDSICIIEDCTADEGEFVATTVVDTADYDLIVRQN